MTGEGGVREEMVELLIEASQPVLVEILRSEAEIRKL